MDADYDSMNAMWYLVWPAFAFAATLLVALVARAVLERVLRRRMRAPDSLAAFLKAVHTPSLLWGAVLALYVALEASELPRRLTAQLELAFQVALILSVTLTAAGIVTAFIGLASERRALGGPVTGLAQTAARVTVIVVGVLVLLSVLGIHVTPLLTALGVGGLAVALALQDSLANFFAGIHILIEEPIALGASIRLSTGEEGIVTDIGWRTTRVRNGNNNVVVIPNTKITSGILINYNLPDTRLSAEVAVMVAHDADVDQVRRIALEEAHACEGVLATPEPAIFFNPGLLPTHLQFTLVFNVAEFGKRAPAQSAVRLRIYQRLRA